jgi:hypothetical protein
MRYGRRTTVEEILEVENGTRMTYTVVSGIPVRNYLAEVSLTSTDQGTFIHWNADWDRTLAGRVVHKKLRVLYPEIVTNLISAADQSGSFPFTAHIDEKR